MFSADIYSFENKNRFKVAIWRFEKKNFFLPSPVVNETETRNFDAMA